MTKRNAPSCLAEGEIPWSAPQFSAYRRKQAYCEIRMTARPTLEDVLIRLREIRADLEAPGAIEELASILVGKSCHAAAKAAEIAAEAELGDLVPSLVTGFFGFMEDPVKTDPGCRAKEAIVNALQQLDAAEPSLFLAAVRHVQLEPVYGGRQETAAGLRGAAARGLVRMNHPEAMVLLAELLADPEPPARTAAARAIGYHGGDQGLPLLRLKVLSGDTETDVLGDCLLAMLQISPDSSIEFVERFLDADRPAMAEAAALALGESRVEAALPVLRRWWERIVEPKLAATALLAIAILRTQEAVDFLLELIREAPAANARHAIAACEIYRGSEATVERVRAAVRARDDVDLTRTVEEILG